MALSRHFRIIITILLLTRSVLEISNFKSKCKLQLLALASFFNPLFPKDLGNNLAVVLGLC
jgi:hypothetical protein